MSSDRKPHLDTRAVVLLLAGGYAASAARTAELHANTFHEAAAIEAAAATGQRARA